MAGKAQISKDKQQPIITLRHEGQSIWNISRTLKVSSSQSQKPSSAKMKLALTGKKDQKLPPLQRICSLELTAPQIVARLSSSKRNHNINCSEETA